MLDIIDTVFPYANFPLWEITSLLRLLADFIIGLTSVAVPTALIWSACHQTPRDARVFELVAVFVAATGAVHILRQVSALGPGTGLLAAGVSALAGLVLLRGLRLDVAGPGPDVAADH